MQTIREFARLTLEPAPPSLDCATIPVSAFTWLAEHARGEPSMPGLVSFDGPRSLRVLNYVGVIETPCGTRLEILPKTTEDAETAEEVRGLLRQMVLEALSLKPRHGTMSQISAFRLPLPDWLASYFLQELSSLIRRGLRHSYLRLEQREPFLRGSLDVARQIRSGPAAAHMFSFRHDVFSLDRPENRLLRSTVELIVSATRSGDVWRLGRELNAALAEIPASTNVFEDLKRWSRDQLMADYASIKVLCELILTRGVPFATSGVHRGLSMLFPMERLFETYVLSSLKRQAPHSLKIRAQVAEQHLCEHNQVGCFRLKPDILASDGNVSWVLDTKWKLLSGDRARNYNLNQSDFYQLFAYGTKYLNGKGDMFLIYPQSAKFGSPLPPFHFTADLRLHVLPFDLFLRTAPYPFLGDG